MPDYNPSRGPGEGPTRRPVVRAPQVRRYGAGGLPTEGADPAPKVHPLAPWIALVFVVGFLCLQLYPATHFRHPKDPSKSWVKIHRTEDGIDHERTWQNAMTVWLGGQQRETIARTETHDVDVETDVQVVLATDEKDLRPLAVVINSTVSNAKYPERIKFLLVIPASLDEVEYFKLKSFFPKASIEIVSKGIDLEKISELVTYRADSKAREELKSPYNFGLYYLPKLLGEKDIDKFIYLDTDVVVKGDLGELYRKGLEDRPVAAVQDCSQRFATYFDFNQLEQIHAREKGSNPWLPTEPFNEEECVFNRGVLLIDVKQWIEQNVTEKIEWWMKESSNAGKYPLFKYGQSQPPYMLALYKNYKVLTHDWNVRGLGRNKFSEKEMELYAEMYGKKIQRQPFRSHESDHAKILHFNGAFKPWKRGRERRGDENVVSLCGEEGQECYKMWWEYLNEIADDKLRGSA